MSSAEPLRTARTVLTAPTANEATKESSANKIEKNANPSDNKERDDTNFTLLRVVWVPQECWSKASFPILPRIGIARPRHVPPPPDFQSPVGSVDDASYREKVHAQSREWLTANEGVGFPDIADWPLLRELQQLFDIAAWCIEHGHAKQWACIDGRRGISALCFGRFRFRGAGWGWRACLTQESALIVVSHEATPSRQLAYEKWSVCHATT